MQVTRAGGCRDKKMREHGAGNDSTLVHFGRAEGDARTFQGKSSVRMRCCIFDKGCLNDDYGLHDTWIGWQVEKVVVSR